MSVNVKWACHIQDTLPFINSLCNPIKGLSSRAAHWSLVVLLSTETYCLQPAWCFQVPAAALTHMPSLPMSMQDSHTLTQSDSVPSLAAGWSSGTTQRRRCGQAQYWITHTSDDSDGLCACVRVSKLLRDNLRCSEVEQLLRRALRYGSLNKSHVLQ